MVTVAGKAHPLMGSEAYVFASTRGDPTSPTHFKPDSHRDSFQMAPQQQSHLNQSLESLIARFYPDLEYALVSVAPDGQYRAVCSRNWQMPEEELYSEEFRGKLHDMYGRRSVSDRSRSFVSNSNYRDYSDDGQSLARSRKRARTSPPAQTCIKLSDKNSLRAFYERCFKEFQQAGCKIFGKAWVKEMEPKKQSNHPYWKGSATGPAPPWWPPTEGPANIKVRHKEPDHLLKQERINLFVHIFDIIVDPNHPCRRTHDRCSKVSIDSLERVTMESLNKEFFVHSKKNLGKKIWIQDLFRVAKDEEKFRRGELDKNATIYTSLGNDISEADPDDDDDEEVNQYNSHIGTSGIATPDTMGSTQEFRAYLPQEGQSGEAHSNYPVMRQLPYRHYTAHVPPSPEDNSQYSMAGSENYSSHPGPTQYVMQQEFRRPSNTWHTAYDTSQQLPPMQNMYTTGPAPLTLPAQMSSYGNNWTGPGSQNLSLPPMQPVDQEQHQHEAAFAHGYPTHGQQT